MDPNHVSYNIPSENTGVIPTALPGVIEPLHTNYKDSESEYDTDDTIEDEAYSVSDANTTVDYALNYSSQSVQCLNSGAREKIMSSTHNENHRRNEGHSNPINRNDDFGGYYTEAARGPCLDGSLKYSDGSDKTGDFRFGGRPQDSMSYQSVTTEHYKQSVLPAYDNSQTVRSIQVTRNDLYSYTDATPLISRSNEPVSGLERPPQICKYDESALYDQTKPLTNFISSGSSTVKDGHKYETSRQRIKNVQYRSDMTDEINVDVLKMPQCSTEQRHELDGGLTNQTLVTRVAEDSSYGYPSQSDKSNTAVVITKDVSYDTFAEPIILSSDSDDIIGVKSIVGVSEGVQIMDNYSEDEVQAVNSSSSIDNDIDTSNLDNSMDIDDSVNIDANELDEADLSGLLTEGNGTEFSEELGDIEQENELSELNETELDENIEDLDDENIAALTEEALHDSGLLKVAELDQSYEEVGELLESLPEVDSLQGDESAAIMEESYDSDILNAVNDLAENEGNISGIIMESVDSAGVTNDEAKSDVANDDTKTRAASHKLAAYSKISANSAKRAKLFDIEKRLKKKRKLLKRRSDGTDEPKKKKVPTATLR